MEPPYLNTTDLGPKQVVRLARTFELASVGDESYTSQVVTDGLHVEWGFSSPI